MAADEHTQLIDNVRRFTERDYGFAARMRALGTEPGVSREHWQTFAELGWLSIGMPAEIGGIGDAADQAAVAQELGRALVLEPWLGNCALAGRLLVLARVAGEQRSTDGLSLFMVAPDAPGMTDEYEVGQCYKRLAACANLFGDAERHTDRLI